MEISDSHLLSLSMIEIVAGIEEQNNEHVDRAKQKPDAQLGHSHIFVHLDRLRSSSDFFHKALNDSAEWKEKKS
jgi:hypothetical protein